MIYGICFAAMQEQLFHCGGAAKAVGMGESPERREGPGRGGKLDRRLSEARESTARIAQGLRKRLGRWRLCVGPVIGARKIRGDLGKPVRGRRVNLSQSLHQPVLRFPPLLPLLPLRTIATLVSFGAARGHWRGNAEGRWQMAERGMRKRKG